MKLPLIPLLVVLLFTAIACSRSDLPLVGGGGAETPTPPGDFITYHAPVYTISLEPGEVVPGTGLAYLQRIDAGYHVTIDGLRAVKRPGDTFAWSGVLAPGVSARFNLRLATTLFGKLTAAGPVEITIYNPDPSELPASVTPEGDYYFNRLTVQFQVPRDAPIPGTSLFYAGYVDPGPTAGQNVLQRMARFSGGGNYPLAARGDSVIWTGRLREDTTIRYSLRVARIGEQAVWLLGTAELWINP